MKENNMCCKEGNPFVTLAAVCGGMFLVVTLFVLIFNKENSGVLIPIVWGFVVLGIVLGAYQLKSLRDPKKKK